MANNPVMADNPGRPEVLHCIRQLIQALTKIQANWNAHLEAVSSELSRKPAIPHLQPLVGVQDAVAYLEMLTQFGRGRRFALFSHEALLPDHLVPSVRWTHEPLPEHIAKHFDRTTVSVETGSWKLKKAMARVEKCLSHYPSNTLIPLESTLTAEIERFIKMSERLLDWELDKGFHALRVIYEEYCAVRSAIERNDKLSDLERFEAERDMEDLIVELDCQWEKHSGSRSGKPFSLEVEKHGGILLNLLRRVAEMGFKIPRQTLITEYFFLEVVLE